MNGVKFSIVLYDIKIKTRQMKTKKSKQENEDNGVSAEGGREGGRRGGGTKGRREGGTKGRREGGTKGRREGG